MSETDTLPDSAPEVDPIEVIHESQCPSLSQRSTLTFAVGRQATSRALHLRIVHNSGGGMFCDEWIPGSDIDAVVIGATGLTSQSFQGLKPGRSTNTAGFAMAVVRSLGLIRTNAENSRVHEHVPTETFEKVVLALINGPASTKPGRRKTKDG